LRAQHLRTGIERRVGERVLQERAAERLVEVHALAAAHDRAAVRKHVPDHPYARLKAVLVGVGHGPAMGRVLGGHDDAILRIAGANDD
jgi:hypothetical protein